MEQVRNRDYSMIEKALDAIDADVEWSQEEEGDLYLNLGVDPVAGCAVEAWLNIEGDENDVYAIRLQSDK